MSYFKINDFKNLAQNCQNLNKKEWYFKIDQILNKNDKLKNKK